MAFGPAHVSTFWVPAVLASTPEDNGAPGLLLILAVGLVGLCAVLAVLAYIGWRATRTGTLPPPVRRRRAARAAAPPDADVEWEAEIEWHPDPGGGARFFLVADREGLSEGTAVSASEPLGWPPTGPESVNELKRAVEHLEAGALAAGWSSAPPGEAWYAKRFVWEPARAPTRAPAGSVSPRSRLDSNQRPAD